jgi:hypothetical protein
MQFSVRSVEGAVKRAFAEEPDCTCADAVCRLAIDGEEDFVKQRAGILKQCGKGGAHDE